MEEIALNANISKGLIYLYFKNKEDVLIALLQQIFDEITKSFDTKNTRLLTPQDLENFLNNYLEILSKKYTYWQLYFALMLQPEVLSILHSEKFRTAGIRILTMLEEYLSACGFKNPPEEASILHYLFDGMTLNYLSNPVFVDIESFKKYILKKYIEPYKDKFSIKNFEK